MSDWATTPKPYGRAYNRHRDGKPYGPPSKRPGASSSILTAYRPGDMAVRCAGRRDPWPLTPGNHPRGPSNLISGTSRRAVDLFNPGSDIRTIDNAAQERSSDIINRTWLDVFELSQDRANKSLKGVEFNAGGVQGSHNEVLSKGVANLGEHESAAGVNAPVADDNAGAA